jgi:tetratricopeptide (TPR) repeat protein
METLIDNWNKAEPENTDMLTARFYYYIAKAQGTEVVARKEAKYLGAAPMLTLQDSTGVDVHYYEVLKYDDEIFSQALKVVDHAISLYPQRLEFRFMKANAYLSYERESPDMALSNILGLAHDYMTSGKTWTYNENSEQLTVDQELFAQMIQDYCVTLYALGSPASYEAFLKLSQRMNGYFPKVPSFLANIGSYHMVVAKDPKTALKYYDKALKIEPKAREVINNAILAARKLKNTKLEKKYLKLLQQSMQ